MSNNSGASSGTSRSRGRVVGIPKKCWCGDHVVARMSKSNDNPYRRYFRCAYAASLRLKDDDHVFQWVDEGTIHEVERMDYKLACLEGDVKELRSVALDNDGYGKMRLKIETDVFERVEDVLLEAKSSMKKTMILVVLGCLTMVVIGILVKEI